MSSQRMVWTMEVTAHLQEARAIIAADHPKVLGHDHDVKIIWSSRMVATHGLACYRERTIKLATVHWAHYSEAYRREIVFHELAHIAAIDLYGRAGSGHGWRWASIMRALGYPDARRFARPGEGDERASARKRAATYRFRASCACDQEHELSARKAATIRRGRHYICKICRQRLVLLTNSQPGHSQPGGKV